MRKHASAVLGVALLTFGLLGPAATGANAAARRPARFDAVAYLRTHGYLPIHGLKALRDAKAYAARWAALHHPAANRPSGGAAPTIGTTWNGITQTFVTPYDANGAIGPNSYLEDINTKLGIYKRNGSLTTSASFATLTGDGGFLSDPMVLWDPDTQRFYYNIWNVGNNHMDWGFSKTDNPTSIPGGFCNYSTNFNYPSGSLIDYPKLGQTKQFLLIGVNFYPTQSNLHATHSDVLWTSKPQGSGPITTCPSAGTFKHGKFQNLRNGDGTQAFTPVPAIQTDPSNNGFVVTASDIECPDICGTGNLITVHAVRPNPSDPTVPQMLITGHSVTVATFAPPPDAPMKNTTNRLDTLDGRLFHAVSGVDPNVGSNVIWLDHTVMGGAGAETRWYEIKPTPIGSPSLVQSGKATSPSLYVFNGGISPDRTVNPTGSAHGGAMVMGFTTSSSSAFPAVQMVSKVGANPQSAFVLVHASTSFENDFSCSPTCRWGDYSGATPDPAASLSGNNGEVWLTNEWADGGSIMRSWNWEALP